VSVITMIYGDDNDCGSVCVETHELVYEPDQRKKETGERDASNISK
jgi:hypothetical protein